MSVVLTLGLAADTLWLPSIFSEGMVPRRETPVPVCGRASPGVGLNRIVHWEHGSCPDERTVDPASRRGGGRQ